MGKSALKLVLSQLQVVDPQEGDQPAYVRSNRTIQTSPRLRWHQRCVGSELRDKTFDSRDDARKALTAAARTCVSKNPHPKKQSKK